MWDGYWQARQHLDYYRVVKEHLEQFGPMESVLDIGCGGCPVATWGDFKQRTAINLEPFPSIEGVACVVSDWLKYPAQPVSVITCLQVLEHIDWDHMTTWVDKMMSHCQFAIISVPWMWPEGSDPAHIHDPIGWGKLLRMLGRQPAKFMVSTQRAICVVNGDCTISLQLQGVSNAQG